VRTSILLHLQTSQNEMYFDHQARASQFLRSSLEDAELISGYNCVVGFHPKLRERFSTFPLSSKLHTPSSWLCENLLEGSLRSKIASFCHCQPRAWYRLQQFPDSKLYGPCLLLCTLHTRVGPPRLALP
jgi:hypothetical protein